MSKSPVVIAVIGIGGCVAMSLMMRTALDVQRERERDPLEHQLESRFGHRLVEPARVSTVQEDGKLRLVVELCVIAGLKKGRFVETAGQLAWESRRDSDDEPAELVVVVTDDGPGETLTKVVPRPRFRY